ncbi:hypothetical protein [Catellatospora tritici]|uniref:hypothetical protein n=1 Tax=Catellatospora tritici TaxID=2851566 RepID=UPI001C2CCB9E|nr:hypothetical protein [Catellatospora tritici]MBV1853664.1 hypothetical protein [Catellatospora tritici]
MRPRLIREVPSDDLRAVVAGPQGRLRLRLFDDDLLPRGEWDLPALDPRLRFAPLPGQTACLVAAGEEVLLVARDGTVRWRHRQEQDPEHPDQATPFADRDGTLWLYLPGEKDRLVVVDPATGDHLAQYADDEDSYGVAAFSHAYATFFPHPDGLWTGLAVGAGDWGSTSFWIRYADGRITVRECPGEVLAGFDSAGARYLATHHEDEEFAMRAFPDGEVLASCHVEDIAGWQADGSYRIDYGGFLVDDDLVLVSVEGDVEDDVLLSSHTLHWVDTIDYGLPTPGRAWPSNLPGHWLTCYDDVTRLWALP